MTSCHYAVGSAGFTSVLLDLLGRFQMRTARAANNITAATPTINATATPVFDRPPVVGVVSPPEVCPVLVAALVPL